MAKKKSKKQTSQAADAVRSAVDQAFQAGQAQFSRERASELVEDLSQVAGRLREALDDLRPVGPEDIQALSDRIDALAARVAKLEKPAPAKRTAAKRAPAKRTTARKPAAKRAAPRKPTGS
jgi:polyhydroxyalkanoate synthesis regulator phasin